MSALTLYPEDERLPRNERIVLNLYIITALALFLFLMTLGLIVRMTQAKWLAVSSVVVYRLLTMHGAGMVGTMTLVTIAIMWFFLRKYVDLHLWAFVTNYVLFLLGAVAILAAVFIGNFAGLWTFLYPLPVTSGGQWTVNAAALFMVGYLLIGIGLLVFYFDAAAAIIKRFGNLGRALGLQWLFRGEIDPSHPKTVVASTMVIIANSLGVLAGAVVLVMSLINAYYPTAVLNALMAKNLIYWFGHMIINATIYMGVIGVYELVPRYSGRPYAISRPFLWAWTVSCVFVIIVFPHHLLMDYAEPRWAEVIGQLASYAAGFPVFLVTAYGVLTNIYRAKMRWTLPSMLLVLSMYGWAAGIVPAILDSTISVNLVMHNTQWVPGHFHFYLILGVLSMVLAFMFHVVDGRVQGAPAAGGRNWGLPIFIVGALTFTLAFLDAGHLSVPRRYAVHVAAWLPTDRAGSIGAMLIIVAMTIFTVYVIAGLFRARTDVLATNAPD